MENEIYQTKNFIVEAHQNPFVSRNEGGHIRIRVKNKDVIDRTKLNPIEAIELMRLTMIVGEAFEIAMNRVGIKVVKINYQDMGNWAYKENKLPFLHIHIFGRVTNAIKQPWPESLYLPDRKTGFYDEFESLNKDDILIIKEEIERIFIEDRYQDTNWHL